MTNPNDPWGQRPQDAPTEHLAGKSGFEQPLHTTEYADAYGSGAPSAYPATEQFDQWSPPPPNATRELPPHDNQWGAYESTYGGGQWAGVAPPPSDAVPPGAGMLPPEPPPRRNTGLWIALGLGTLALVAVIGIVGGVLLAGKDSSSTSAASTSAFPTASRPLPGTPRGTPSGVPSVPGLGGIDNLGATMGTITTNDGTTLSISSLLGSAVTVHTDANTQVISMSGTKVSDLPTGDIVLIQGDKAADGSIQAKVIISTALPGGGK
ncbi:DUF5666 domain-containing protein [Nocardia sp. NBC_01499]|uniref:DUF5666 domain-containing protein n=1 Tax=Nocardia sp. NBC_01499 TaxID=2903597 RepID=UPI0038680964